MNKTNTIVLKWERLTPFLRGKIEYDYEVIRGVYLWGFKIEGAFVPYYVGKAENIKYRIHEHVNNIIGGKYTIFHEESLKEFTKFKFESANIKAKNGKLFSPDWPYGFNEFIQYYDVLLKHFKNMIDRFEYSYAEVSKERYSNVELALIENTCINKIGKENLINTRAGKTLSNLKFEGNDFVAKVFNG